MTYTIPLEFEGSVPLPDTFAPGYDCRICLVLRGNDEDAYQFRTKKDERLVDGRQVDTYKILVGEGTICLPDHHYAHADHDWVERITYAEMLQARLPVEEFKKIGVLAWQARETVC